MPGTVTLAVERSVLLLSICYLRRQELHENQVFLMIQRIFMVIYVPGLISFLLDYEDFDEDNQNEAVCFYQKTELLADPEMVESLQRKEAKRQRLAN